MHKLKNILKCLNKNALIAFCFTLLLGIFCYLYIRNFKKISEDGNKQIYSLIEGTINGEKTYFLISTDSTSSDNKEPKVYIDSTIAVQHDFEKKKCEISLDGNDLTYSKEMKDLKPLINEVKKNSGYKISGVIGNDPQTIDTLK